MDVTPLVKTGSKIIQSYAGGTFRISGQLYQGPVIVMADQVVAWEAAADKSGLSFFAAEDFQALLTFLPKIDVVLLGCGGHLTLLPPKLRAELKAVGLSVDVMDTGAACRTYNVLLAEGRRVLAALLPV